ncbi:hypothetical protein ACJ41O_000819 [Fusarium nematophilum]
MAEPFGIASGAIGIASAFSTCVEVFDYVKLGRQFGRDYQTEQLRLTTIRLRLSRWGEGVRVYDDPKLGDPTATNEQVQHGKDKLLQILRLFEDSATVSNKFKLKHQDDDSSPFGPDSGDSLAVLSVCNKMKSLAVKRQRGASLGKLTRWAIHDRKTLKQLIDDMTALLDGLELLFPIPSKMRDELVAEETRQVQGQEESKALATASEGLDQVIHEALATRVVGHQYKNVRAEGDGGSMMNGNIVTDGYQGKGASGSSHVYDGVEISGSGVRVLNGDQFGGKGFF